MIEFVQLIVVGLSTGSAFALVGMSLVLVFRTTGIVNFAQGVFAVTGGLFTFQLSDDLPLVLAMLVSVLLAAFLSSILAVVAVGFRDRTTSLASTIITLGAAFWRRRCSCSSSAISRAAIGASPTRHGTSGASSSSRSTCSSQPSHS